MYYDINEHFARLSHEITAMSPYPEGSATAEYRARVDSVVELVARQKQNVYSTYHDELDALLDCYARRLARWTNDCNRFNADCFTPILYGPVTLSMYNGEGIGPYEDSLWRRRREIDEIPVRISRIGADFIGLSVTAARRRILEHIHELQMELQQCEDMNTYYRLHDTMQGFPGMSDEAATKWDRKIEHATIFERAPHSCAKVTELRQKIRMAKRRLKDLNKANTKGAKARTESLRSGRIVQNVKSNQLQIFFDNALSEDIRRPLREHGFRWSSQTRAWERPLSSAAELDAQQILNGEIGRAHV